MLVSSIALAHDPFVSVSKQSQWPIILSAVFLFIIWMLYCIGCFRIWPGFKRWFLFQLTIFMVGVTIFGPLDEWAETNAAAHMTQHMLMMTIIAPLWVLAQPLPQLSKSIGRFAIKKLFPLFVMVRYPMLTALIHGAVIWLWHAPKLYLLALNNSWWHIIEHACFIVTAGLFWWSVLRCTRLTVGRALLALLFTLMHTGFLGALFTFAHTSLYGKDASLQNQQLAGLIMWVAGAIPYMLAAIRCSQRWLKQITLNSLHANNSNPT